jgi:hypothetical protein
MPFIGRFLKKQLTLAGIKKKEPVVPVFIQERPCSFYVPNYKLVPNRCQDRNEKNS